jgi:hypothetical protein
MGTSQSNPGPGGGTPLVPPWADDQPEKPIPEPLPGRFRSFRQSLGSFIKTGNKDELHSALNTYSRKSSGGAAIATRRLGAVTQTGANLYSALAGNANLLTPDFIKLIDMGSLTGQPCDLAIAALVDALTPENGDTDKIRTAMNHALVEALDGVEIFDPNAITDEIIVNTMIGFLAECVFLQIVNDAGDAWKKAETPERESAASDDLWELIKVVVDKYMAPKFSTNVRTLTREEYVALERSVIEAVWKEWSEY